MTERANRQWAVGVVMFGIAMTREKSWVHLKKKKVRWSLF
jgi:hypothetical protein